MLVRLYKLSLFLISPVVLLVFLHLLTPENREASLGVVTTVFLVFLTKFFLKSLFGTKKDTHNRVPA